MERSTTRNGVIVACLLLALFIASVAWTMLPAPEALTAPITTEPASPRTLCGRVISVGASGQFVTIEATNGPADVNGITVGDPVEVLRATPSSPDGGQSTLSRRLLGVWLLAVSGAVVAFRARRSLTS